MTLRLARMEEAETCYQFIEDARAYHRWLGFVQWHPGYPTLQTIQNDIAGGNGYVFCDGEMLVGYCCILMGPEADYRSIDGSWKTDLPYAVVHRLAFGAPFRGKGLSHAAMEEIKLWCKVREIRAIRLDTQEENKPMQHVLAREGFRYCGIILFDGGPKLAYEWNA